MYTLGRQRKIPKIANFGKKTKTGDLNESDSVVFKKILDYYSQNHEANSEGKSTYPTKSNPQG